MIFQDGRYNRVMRTTDENEASSRSHLILMIKFVRVPKKGGKHVVGKFTLIDLAGSENLKRIGVDPRIYEEGLSIIYGLSHLGDVIR